MELCVRTGAGERARRRSVKDIYTASFQKEDRMPFWMMRLMAKRADTELLTFHDGDALCGFAYVAAVDGLAFVMFLAVDEAVRAKGSGSGMLDKIRSRYPDHKILVSIERCDEDVPDIVQRVRRKAFYQRNGYAPTGFLIELGNKKQEILIQNGVFDAAEFALFFKKYSNGAMKPKIWKIN